MSRPPATIHPRRSPQPADGQMTNRESLERGALRSRARGSTFRRIAHRITERDIRILLDIYEHRVLTTRQIAQLHFGCERVALRRLAKLCEFELLWAYRPNRDVGSHPYHFFLLKLGAEIIASRLETDLKGIGWFDQQPIRFAKSPRLTHWRETNDYFAALAHACRTTGRASLAGWWGERSAGRGLPLTPDGIGLLRTSEADLRFLLELDRGTENHTQLRAKLSRYARIAQLPDVPRLLLFVFPSHAREAQARPELHVPGLTVATAVLADTLADPLGEVWLAARRPLRLSILDLSPGSTE